LTQHFNKDQHLYTAEPELVILMWIFRYVGISRY